MSKQPPSRPIRSLQNEVRFQAGLRRSLLAWYSKNRRTLPWRTRPTPYRVWISEIMLQQTRVDTVLPYYRRFLARFPDIASLASASESEVLALWAGLGYYRRARNLRVAAIKIRNEWEGEFPATMERIRELPGIGRYTAGAIASIAYDQPHPAVDGNVRRVIGRVRSITSAPESFFWTEAERWLDRSQPSAFNQALMELGALICTPMRPRCPDCPIRELCAFSRSPALRKPRNGIPKTSQTVIMAIVVIRAGGCVLLEQTNGTTFIPGNLALPAKAIIAEGDPTNAAATLTREALGRASNLAQIGIITHAITSRRIRAYIFMAKTKRSRNLPERYCWRPEAQARAALTSSLFHKVLRIAGVPGAPQ
jgi:A/G-specific adenine glycosylase